VTPWQSPAAIAGRSLSSIEATHYLKVLVPGEADQALPADHRTAGRAGAEGIITGCTEIELLVTSDDAGLPYFPPGCAPRP
jgi:hypothetical protein